MILGCWDVVRSGNRIGINGENISVVIFNINVIVIVDIEYFMVKINGYVIDGNLINWIEECSGIVRLSKSLNKCVEYWMEGCVIINFVVGINL